MGKGPWSDIHSQVHRLLRQRSLLPPGASVVVAVSGGQDSVCLLKLLVDLQPKWHWRLQVVHCDHGWRDDSAANATFVQDLCQGWAVPCQVVTAESVPTTEAKARQWRYQVLEEGARAGGHSHIVTGHTATDRAETLLYNLVRGSGTDGLQALAWSRPLGEVPGEITVVRPLLNLTRQDTAQVCKRFELSIWPDSTNQDLAYRRNRLRLEVMPYLQQHFNPRAETSLAQTAEILTAEVELLTQMAQDLYTTGVEPGHESSPWRIDRRVLGAAPLALQRRVMRQVLQRVTAAQGQVNFDQVEKLVALITAPNRTQTDPFPGGWVARVEGDWILLSL